jgi:hypothetical protein
MDRNAKTFDAEAACLGWGLAASLLLVVVTAISSIAEISAASDDLIRRFQRRDRSALLIAEQLSRMRWKALAPRILFLRSELIEAASALELGNAEAADGLLDSLVSREAKVMDDLTQWSRLDTDATNKALGQARSHLRSLQVAEGLVSLLLGSGTLTT